MPENMKITCIICPIGRKILVDNKGDKVEISSRNKCKKGIDYATYEALDPRRVLTTSVLVEKGEWPLVSVKSSKPIPKDKIFAVLEEVKKVKLRATVRIGSIIIKNVAKTGIDIISTKSINRST